MKKLLLTIFLFFFILIFGSKFFVSQKLNNTLVSKFQINDNTEQVDAKNEQINILNDPLYKKNWGIQAIKAEQAWLVAKNNKKIVVAVIDTGVDVEHEDLKANIWMNPGETGLDENGNDKATNGIDDDGNGLVDDVYGWNFLDYNNDLTDNHGHGTHIAGIIGAVQNNNIGTAGIASNVSIMVLKYFDPKSDNKNSFNALLSSIKYAINNGADIINYSGGGSGFSSQERLLLKKAKKRGILVVTAAGNESNDTDKTAYYPSSYRLSNLISVASASKKGSLTNSSNYGAISVDIAAPGDGIFSTLPNNRYGILTGTSQATAFVTAAAANIYSINSSYGYKQIKRILLSKVFSNNSLSDKVISGGFLNLSASIDYVMSNLKNNKLASLSVEQSILHNQIRHNH